MTTMSLARSAATRLTLVACVVLLLAPARRATGQGLVEQWPGLRPSALMTVYVTNTDGDEAKGRLLALGPDTLTLLVDGVEQHIPRTTIARIQRRDSLKNGAIAGAVIGVVMGLISGGLADCPGGDSGSCRSFRLAILPLSTAVYAGVGVAIDASTPGRTTIYDAGRHNARLEHGPPSRPHLALATRLSW